MAGLLSYVPVDVQGDMRQLYKKGTGLLGEAGAYLSEGTPESTGSIAGDIGQAIPIVGRKARDIATGIPRGFMSVTEPLLPEIANIYNQIEAGARGLPMPEDTTGNYLEEVQQNLTNQFGQFAVPLGDESPTKTPIKTPPKKNKLDQEAIDRALAEDAFKRLNDPKVPNTAQDALDATNALKDEAAGSGNNVDFDVDGTGEKLGVDKSTWDRFNSEFDLTTIGLSLLATSANGQPLAANLGLAMEAGKLAKTKEADKKESKAEREAKAKIEAEDRALRYEKTQSEIAYNAARTAELANGTSNSITGATNVLKFKQDQLDYTNDQMAANATENTIARTNARSWLGHDIDDKLDSEETKAVDNISNIYAGHQALVRNALVDSNIKGLSASEKAALAQMVMVRNNPLLVENLDEDAFNINPQTQAKLNNLLQTPNGEFFLQNVITSTGY